MQSSTNRFSDNSVQTCDIKSYVTTFDIPTNPPMKKNTVVEFTAVAQKDSSLSRGKISGPSIQISLSITHKDVFSKPEVKILNREPSYSSFFSAWCTDFKNVIFEKIHWAPSEVAEVAEVKRPRNPKRQKF